MFNLEYLDYVRRTGGALDDRALVEFFKLQAIDHNVKVIYIYILN